MAPQSDPWDVYGVPTTVTLADINMNSKHAMRLAPQSVDVPFARDASAGIHRQACRFLLWAQPIYVTQTVDGAYAPVGGHRVLEFARQVLPPYARVQVQLLRNDAAMIRELTVAERLVLPFLFALKVGSTTTVRKWDDALSAQPMTRKLRRGAVAPESIDSGMDRDTAPYAASTWPGIRKPCARRLLMLMPPIVARAPGKRWSCVANTRVFEIVADAVDPSEPLPVLVGSRSVADEAWACADHALCAGTHALASGAPPALGGLYMAATPEELELAFGDGFTKSAAHRRLGYSRYGMFYRKDRTSTEVPFDHTPESVRDWIAA